jgi:hypothetical protein
VRASTNADIAQLVEQVIRNDQVVGSNPTIGFSAASQVVVIFYSTSARTARGRIALVQPRDRQNSSRMAQLKCVGALAGPGRMPRGSEDKA